MAIGMWPLQPIQPEGRPITIAGVSTESSKSDRHVDTLLALSIDAVDGKRPFFRAGHARRTGRHAGKRQSVEGWILGQPFLHRLDWYVPVDHIVADQGGMASLKISGMPALSRSMAGFVVRPP